MAYRILYPGMKQYGKNRIPMRLQAMTAAFLFLFILIVRLTWSQGWEILEPWLMEALDNG